MMIKRTILFSGLSALSIFAVACSKTDYRCSSPGVVAKVKKLYVEKYSPITLLVGNEHAEAKKDVDDYLNGLNLSLIQTTDKTERGFMCRGSMQSPSLSFKIEGGPYQAPPMSVDFIYKVQLTDDGAFAVYGHDE